MRIKGWPLNFFNSGEWQVCNERLKDLEKVYRRINTAEHPCGDGYNPGRASLFRALQLLPSGKVKVCVLGQDPFPSRAHATGVAFSVPATLGKSDWPPTLTSFIREYCDDLGHPSPSNGNLERWSTEEGVLLWNAIPSTRSGHSLSHNWEEWRYLTNEIISTLADKGIVFASLGVVARGYLNNVSLSNNRIIHTSHPSPRGNISSKSPFTGSRLFSTINVRLAEISLPPVNWKLP